MNPVGSGASVASVIAMREAVLERSRLLSELQQAAPASDAVASGAGGGFAETLQGALADVNAAQQRSATLSEAYERGQVQDVTQVMLARQEAGVAFEATLQVRNKLLSAYQDIMRMGI